MRASLEEMEKRYERIGGTHGVVYFEDEEGKIYSWSKIEGKGYYNETDKDKENLMGL